MLLSDMIWGKKWYCSGLQYFCPQKYLITMVNSCGNSGLVAMAPYLANLH